MTAEGVIQFRLDYTPGPPLPEDGLADLAAWRRIFHRLHLIGQDPDRYGGYGFGNISRRSRTGGAAPGFFISGSQTGHLSEPDGRHWAAVTDWSIAGNRVTAHGPVPPSSESLAHAALYEAGETVGAVIHAHCPPVWHWGLKTGQPATPPEAAHGTVAMAVAVADAFHRIGAGSRGLLILAGHEDGILSFGEDLRSAGLLLVETLAAAFRETGR